MQHRDKNLVIVEKMLKYCDKIITIRDKEKLTKEKYMKSDIIQLAIDMCIFQLTELSVHIDDDFKIKHLDIPWAQIKGMRNIHAHEYDKIDRNIIWNTIENDMLDLKSKLLQIISDNYN